MISKKDGRYKGAVDMMGIPLMVIDTIVTMIQNIKQHLQFPMASLAEHHHTVAREASILLRR
jgi:hypothetical protein